jgi:serine phosphatase RsbU (regulator of sigma subunit)
MTIAMTGQIVVPHVARWCGVYLDDERGQPVLQQVWHEDEDEMEPLRDALRRTAPAELAGSEDPRLDGTVISIPLETRGREIGWLALGRPPGHRFRGERLLAAETIARRAALAIDNARAHAALSAAGQALQRSLLPASVPEVPGVQVGVVYEPAGEGDAAGGDFYDVFPTGGGRWCFVVGDVCGTGAEAAALTGMARHTVRALMRAGFSIAATLERLNDAILDEGTRARFLTLVCGTLEPVDGGRFRLGLVCAGHPPPFHVVARSGEVRQTGRPQLLLGVLDRVAYTVEEQVLEHGDTIVTVTDGVLERRNGARMLDEEGVIGQLAASRDLPAQAVADQLRQAVVEFADEPSRDDLAILVLRLGSPGSGD